MSGSSAAERVRALAAPAVESIGLLLEEVVLTPAGRRRLLRVVVDLPDGAEGAVSMEAVAAASHAVSAVLDASEVMGATPYVLEVSSPGVERPLATPRHWSRARGRLVRVTTAERGTVTGRLTAVHDDGITLDDDVRFGWGEVLGGRVEVDFKAVPAAPDDVVSGEDELSSADEGEA